jgi:hypothetical protein
MPQEVQETTEGILQILDSEYGAKKKWPNREYYSHKSM